MGLLKKLFGKKEEVSPEQVYLNNLKDMDEQLKSIFARKLKVERSVSAYERLINEQLERLKKEPNNKIVLTSVTNLLVKFVTKKVLAKSYLEIIKNKEAELHAKKTEYQATKGESLIDQNFIRGLMDEVYQADQDYEQIQGAEAIEEMFETLKRDSGLQIGGDLGEIIKNEVSSLVADVVNPKSEVKSENSTTKPVETVKETVNNEIEQLIKKLKEEI